MRTVPSPAPCEGIVLGATGEVVGGLLLWLCNGLLDWLEVYSYDESLRCQHWTGSAGRSSNCKPWLVHYPKATAAEGRRTKAGHRGTGQPLPLVRSLGRVVSAGRTCADRPRSLDSAWALAL